MPVLFKKLVKLVVIGLYNWLTVWAGGGWSAFIANPARVMLLALTLMLIGTTLFTNVSMSSGVREDRGNRWVLVLLSVIGTTSMIVPAWCDHREIWTWGGEPIRYVGLTLYGLGGVLRVWPIFVLGRRFSALVAIQQNHTLVTTGIYRMIRHPSYAGLLVLMVGWALVFRSVLGFLLVISMVPPLIARIRSEEALLASEFGPAYEAFRRQTRWKLLPGLY